MNNKNSTTFDRNSYLIMFLTGNFSRIIQNNIDDMIDILSNEDLGMTEAYFDMCMTVEN